MTRTEQALQALYAILAAHPSFPDVRRNAVLDDIFEEFAAAIQSDAATPAPLAALILRDGTATGEARFLGADGGEFELLHTAEVEWFVCAPAGPDLDQSFDAGLEALGDAIRADRTLGGLITWAEIAEPPLRDTDLAGARPVKTASIKINLHFVSPDPF